ncbi:MAG: phage terminase small subunit P27 family [Burkholderiales bacterium]|nr:phage terminase small subunit P27 family [Burkholderiales bacterium]
MRLHEGNRGRRPINLADGVNPPVEEPDIPKHLCREARKEWKKIVPELLALGLLTKIDRSALAMYCQVHGRMVELEVAFNRKIDALVEQGVNYNDAVSLVSVDVTPSGYKQQSALFSTIKGLREECTRNLAKFGMSPSDRARVTPSSNQLSFPGMDKSVTGWQKFA